MAQRIDIHNRSIAGRKRQIKTWKLPAQEQCALLRFIEELELGKVNKGRKISESRQCKYLDVLRLPLEFFGKPATRLRLPDLETFEKAISSGQLQSNRKGPYAHSSKVDIRRALKVYLRWRLGATKASALVGWFDTRHVNKTPDYLKESDIEALLKTCKSAEERFLVAVLFDTGARATEFHNIRYEDIQLPREGSSYAKITLKEEYSKTKGRMVSLYWKHSLDALRDYLHQREIEGIRADEPVFKRAYTAARLFLHRLGMRVLKRSIHYHLFRHSSATYYASKLNRQQLCIRYGWAFSSRMPDVYIARSGVDVEELDKKFTRDGSRSPERFPRPDGAGVEGEGGSNRTVGDGVGGDQSEPGRAGRDSSPSAEPGGSPRSHREPETPVIPFVSSVGFCESKPMWFSSSVLTRS